MQKEVEGNKRITQCMGCMEIYEAFDDICPYCGYINGTMPEEMYHLEPGTVLDKKYLVGKVLGFGGFGVTYIAWDQILQRKVAIKEYFPRECASRMNGTEEITIFTGDRKKQFRNGLKSFKEEAAKLMKLHDIIGTVNVFAIFEENNTAYLVMEYLDGCTLAQMLKEKKKMPVEEALKMIRPVIRSLQEIHKNNLIHRDITPDNIFITKSGELKVLDFGSARYSALAQNKSISVIVKKGYAPPEQYQLYKDQGPWTDVYSLAATIYKMITGKVPEDSITRMVKDTLEAPSALGITITKSQENALLNALNTKISSRTQTMDAFEKQLFSEEEVPRIDNETGQPVKKPQKKWILPVIAAGICVLCIGAFLRMQQPKKDTAVIQQQKQEEKYVVGNYVGVDLEKAENAAKESELQIVITNRENSDKKEGVILSQDPAAGKEVGENNKNIYVIVSAGNEKVKMPDYVGISSKKCAEIEKADNIRTVTSESKESNIIPEYVVEQSEKAGNKIAKGATVTLSLSAGRKNIKKKESHTMPELIGKTFDAALKEAEKSQIYIGISKHEYSTSYKKNTISAQSIEKGKKVFGGTEILLTISDGPEQMKVPDVVKKGLEEAKVLLEQQKLKHTVTFEYNDEYGEGIVLEQSVKAGKKVDEGSTIDLVVSKGAKKEPEKTRERSSKSSGGSSKKKSSSSSKSKSSKKYSSPSQPVKGYGYEPSGSGSKRKNSGDSLDDWEYVN